MGRKIMPVEASAYYPPRARWYGLFFYFGNAVRRRLALDRLALPRGIKLSELLAGFFVPGLAVYLRGPKLWGQAALSAWAALFLFYVVGLGHPVANLAFGLMISLHATGLVYYCNPLLVNESFPTRIAVTLLVLIAIGLGLYLPTRNLVQAHWLVPLQMNGRVVVVQRLFQLSMIKRGDWVAYTYDENATGHNYHGGVVQLQNGMGLGPVLAVAGDQVVFSNNLFSVNGIWQTNLPHMPASGELVVPEKHWFIWPNLGISGHGNVGEARISSALLGLASVDESNFWGSPFHRWFGRKQILP